nr:reverse transcriptase domain-containing protein [Rhizobium oryziradicis]
MPCCKGGGDNCTMPDCVIASTQQNWIPRDKDIKKYLHFDRTISEELLASIANDPNLVSRHSFFPLIRFFESWIRFRHGGKRIEKKRPLRYAARIDAAIFARYRALLSDFFEAELKLKGLSSVPVAYRRLPRACGGNKSSIDIAKEVFDFIRSCDNCIVTVVDIKSYFESLDHGRIRQCWEALIKQPLPPDHQAVFNAITKYSVVDYDKIMKRLELMVHPAVGSRGERRKRKIDLLKGKYYKQLCSVEDFRNLVAGGDPNFPSLIQKNGFNFGIPQGTPISDLVANFYLMDFDAEVNSWVSEHSGIYMRYSDDIIVVIPQSNSISDFEVKDFLQTRIRHYGSKLQIQDKKVSISRFSRNGLVQDFSRVFGRASANGLEYLGFQYDGASIQIKNSTLSNAWRKMKRRAYGSACAYVKRYRSKGEIWIRANYSSLQLETNLLRDVTYNQDTGYDTWTFLKYVRRCSRTFSNYPRNFSSQTKRYRRLTKLMIEKSLDKAISVHLK